jgi:hypothetical protein
MFSDYMFPLLSEFREQAHHITFEILNDPSPLANHLEEVFPKYLCKINQSSSLTVELKWVDEFTGRYDMLAGMVGPDASPSVKIWCRNEAPSFSP